MKTVQAFIDALIARMPSAREREGATLLFEFKEDISIPWQLEAKEILLAASDVVVVKVQP